MPQNSSLITPPRVHPASNQTHHQWPFPTNPYPPQNIPQLDSDAAFLRKDWEWPWFIQMVPGLILGNLPKDSWWIRLIKLIICGMIPKWTRDWCHFKPSREALFNELHTRPFPVLLTPLKALPILLRAIPATVEEEILHLGDFVNAMPFPSRSRIFLLLSGLRRVHTALGATHRVLDLSDYSAQTACLRTAIRSGCSGFAATGVDWVAARWGVQCAASRTSGSTAGSTDKEWLRAHFEGSTTDRQRSPRCTGGNMTSYRIHSDGFARFILLNRSLNPASVGGWHDHCSSWKPTACSCWSPAAGKIGFPTSEGNGSATGHGHTTDYRHWRLEDEQRLLANCPLLPLAPSSSSQTPTIDSLPLKPTTHWFNPEHLSFPGEGN